MAEVRVTLNVDAAIDGVADLKKRVHEGVRNGVSLIAGAIVKQAAINASVRPGPTVRTGALRRSIRIDGSPHWDGTAWRVGVGPTIIYARIQEKGGTIVPKRAKVLRWLDANGTPVFANKVTLPARPYFQPAVLMVAKTRAIALMERAVADAIGG